MLRDHTCGPSGTEQEGTKRRLQLRGPLGAHTDEGWAVPPGFGNVAVTKERREGGEWEARRWRLSPWGLLGKAVSWQQGMFEEMALSLRQGRP